MNKKIIEQQTPWVNLDAMAPFLPENPIIVEAGAHVGKDTLKLQQKWPAATIHAFEPVPALFAQLQAKAKNIPQIHCYPYALSNVVGTAPLYVSSGRTDACSSLLQPQPMLTQERPDIAFETIIHVPTITLDAWAAAHRINQVDFLWLDLQGAELRALQGARALLQKVRVIHTEINEIERYAGSVLFNELEQFLIAQGFDLYIKALHKFQWGNAVFIRR